MIYTMKKIQEFEKNSLILFVLMMSSNVCNYVFQITVGNMMAVKDYGVVNTVLAIVGILSIPTTIITMISARYIALSASKGNEDEISSVLQLLFRFIILVGVILLFFGFIGIRRITQIFNLDSAGYVAGALVIAIVNLIFSVTSGTLQGLKKFFPYGVQTVLTAGGKLAFSILLILLGWRVYGVIAAMLCGIILAIVYGLHHMKSYIRHTFQYQGGSIIDVEEFIRYAIGTIVVQSCVIALTNGDVLLVKAFFSDQDAGIYSSAMVIGKIAMYVSTAVIATLFPLVVERNQKGESTAPILKKALFYGGGMALACAVGMITLGKYVIGILFGERYAAAIVYLPYVCLFVVPLTFISILTNYMLAVGKTKVVGISIGVGLIVIIGSCGVFHDTIPHIMMICGTVLSIVFWGNLLYLWYLNQKDRSEMYLENGDED